MRYKAFLSYSHKLDGEIATALQRGLQAFARPLLRLRSMRIFRDSSDLGASPRLWESVQQALESSEFLILCASPESAASPWVQREVIWWLRRRGADSLFLVLTGGEFRHADVPGRGFTALDNGTLPAALCDALEREPRLVDLRWARGSTSLSLRHSAFRAALLDLAAPLLGRDKADLDSEEVRSFRRRRALLGAGAVALVALSLAAAGQGWIARRRLAALRVEVARQATLRGEPGNAVLGVEEGWLDDRKVEGQIVALSDRLPERIVFESVDGSYQGVNFDAAGRRFYLWSERTTEDGMRLRLAEKGFDLAHPKAELGEIEAEPPLEAEARLGRRLTVRATGGGSWLVDPVTRERWRAAVRPGEIWYRDPRSRRAAAATSTSVRLLELPRAPADPAAELCSVPRRAHGFEESDLLEEGEDGDKPIVSFRPDGSAFAVGGFPVQLWGASSCRLIASLPLTASYPEGAWFSRNGRYLAVQGWVHYGSGSAVAAVWTLPESRILARLPGSWNGRWTAGGTQLRLVRGDGIWEWSVRDLVAGRAGRAQPIGPRGTLLALGRKGEAALRRTKAGGAEVLRGAALSPACSIPPSGREAGWMLSPEGRFVVEFGDWTEPWRIFEARTCRPLYDLHPAIPNAGGPLFGSGDQDVLTLGYDMTNGTGAIVREVSRWRLGATAPLMMRNREEFESPDDLLCRMCSTSADEIGVLVDPSPDGVASRVSNLFGPGAPLDGVSLEGTVHGVSASADGTLVLGWIGRALGLWSVATGRQLAAFEGHHGEVQGAALSEDGRFAASWDSEGETIVWRVR